MGCRTCFEPLKEVYEVADDWPAGAWTDPAVLGLYDAGGGEGWRDCENGEMESGLFVMSSKVNLKPSSLMANNRNACMHTAYEL